MIKHLCILCRYFLFYRALCKNFHRGLQMKIHHIDETESWLSFFFKKKMDISRYDCSILIYSLDRAVGQNTRRYGRIGWHRRKNELLMKWKKMKLEVLVEKDIRMYVCTYVYTYTYGEKRDHCLCLIPVISLLPAWFG